MEVLGRGYLAQWWQLGFKSQLCDLWAMWPRQVTPFMLQFLQLRHGANITCYIIDPLYKVSQNLSITWNNVWHAVAICMKSSKHFQVLNTLKRQLRVFLGVWLTWFLHLHKVMWQSSTTRHLPGYKEERSLERAGRKSWALSHNRFY